LLFIFELTFIWKIKIFRRAEVGGRSARLFISFNFQRSPVLIPRVQADTGLIESGRRVSRKPKEDPSSLNDILAKPPSPGLNEGKNARGEMNVEFVSRTLRRIFNGIFVGISPSTKPRAFCELRQ